MATRIKRVQHMGEYGFGRWRTGFWQDSRSVIPVGTTQNFKTLPANQIWGQPFVVYQPVTVDAIQMGLWVAEEGSVVSFQLGRVNPEDQTLTITHDFGTLPADVTGTIQRTFSPVPVDPAPYLLILGTPGVATRLTAYYDLYGALYTLGATGATEASKFIAMKHDTPWPFSGTYEGFPSSANSGTLMAAALRRGS